MSTSITWSGFKNIISSKSLLVNYVEDADKYSIWANEGIDQWTCLVYKDNPANTDQIDFETNYKPSANTLIRSRTLNRTQEQEDTEQGRGFSVASGIIVGGGGSGTDLGIVYVNNPSNSGKNLYLSNLIVGTTTNNRSAVYKLFYNPTSVSGGSVMTPRNLKLGGSATITDIVRAGTLSATSFGTLWQNFIVSQNATVGQYDLDEQFIVTPGNSLILTAQGTSGVIDVIVGLMWYERSS